MKVVLAAAAVLLAFGTCAFVTESPRMVAREEITNSFYVSTPAKVHLTDGSVVVCAPGLRQSHTALVGPGIRFGLSRRDSTPVTVIPLDSVVGVEYYNKQMDIGPTLALAPMVTVGGFLLFKAIFGSCPTVYSYDGDRYTLEAEEFSYSIAPALEGGDLDRLDLGRAVDGEYRLMVTNEALETHYINALSLVTADHPSGCEALPTDDGRIVLLGRSSRFARAVSRDGRDVSALLASRDSQSYESDIGLVRTLADSVVRDWVDIAVPVPPGARKACLAFRFRNTLLNTVWLYDIALKQQGLGALDWVAMGHRNILSALRLRNWYLRQFGLHILASSGRGFREVGRIRDTGPIAWHQAAIEIPVPRSDTLRLRLDFLPDNWMIDWVGLSFEDPGEAEVHTVHCSRVSTGEGASVAGAGELLRSRDKRYLVTGPSDCYYLAFRPEPAPAGAERDWFVRAAGYYTEWLRRDWLRSEPVAGFEADDKTITQAAALWLVRKPDMERLFLETKLPARRSP